MATMSAERTPWPMTSEMRIPAWCGEMGTISKKSPARPEMGM